MESATKIVLISYIKQHFTHNLIKQSGINRKLYTHRLYNNSITGVLVTQLHTWTQMGDWDLDPSKNIKL